MDAELTPHQRGRQSEETVKTILQEMQAEGLIRGFRQTRRFSKDDRRGIDFLIFTEDDRIPIQVKSSFSGQSLHNHYTHKSWIPCVVAKGPGIRRRIVSIIEKHLKGDTDGHST